MSELGASACQGEALNLPTVGPGVCLRVGCIRPNCILLAYSYSVDGEDQYHKKKKKKKKENTHNSTYTYCDYVILQLHLVLFAF